MKKAAKNPSKTMHLGKFLLFFFYPQQTPSNVPNTIEKEKL